MSQLNVDTIKKADGTGNLTIPNATGTVVTTAGATFTGDIAFSNGQGIDFSASEGGGASSSVLDDYEEGTWTPTYTDGSGGTYSSTYGNQAAQYVKIGKLVYINCEIIANNSLTSNGLTGGSELRVSGLPFPNDTVPQATGHIEANFDIPSGYTHTGFFIRNGGTSYVSFRYMGDNVGYNNVTVTMLEGATGSRYVVISGFYATNS
jgi:hypothetical protein